MENKGYNDLVGSPNAPFLNSLINTYGFANNYFARPTAACRTTTRSSAEQLRVTWNCATACIDVPKADTLPGQLDAAGLTWRSYAQGPGAGASPLVSAGGYAFDETGFPAFKFIFDDEGLRQGAHRPARADGRRPAIGGHLSGLRLVRCQ